jgi:hypothetical protein
MLNLNSTWAICKHSKGAWAVWELSRVLKLNMQKAARGGISETWNPVELALSMEDAIRRMAEIKADCRQGNLALEDSATP